MKNTFKWHDFLIFQYSVSYKLYIGDLKNKKKTNFKVTCLEVHLDYFIPQNSKQDDSPDRRKKVIYKHWRDGNAT